MPEMGESVTEGTVLEWHVEEGGSVEEGETVVEVSTDKVDAEVPAPSNGTITKIMVGPDETIEVGKPLAEMAKGEGAPAAKASEDGGAAKAAAAKQAPAEARALPAADDARRSRHSVARQAAPRPTGRPGIASRAPARAAR